MTEPPRSPRQGPARTEAAPDRLTQDEALALALVAIPVSAILLATLADAVGLRFLPWPMLLVSAGLAAATFLARRPRARSAEGNVAAFAAVVLIVGGWLLWLAWPTLLPLSTGPDLTHHLLLISYLERHWRLVHDPDVQRYLGEMAQYTPGSQLLAAFAGAWSGTDGLRALHPMQAWTVALKAGFLFLIARRLLAPSTPRRPLALCSVAMLLAAPRYFLGGFTEFGFVAQVVAELFVVAMWWAAVAWDVRPDLPVALAFSVIGAAAFLTWPVYIGPPALAMFLLIALHGELDARARLRHMLAAFVPLGVTAVMYLAGRLEWLQLAGTGGTAPWPSIADYSWPLAILAMAGLAMLLVQRRGRAAVLMVASIAAQAAAFYVLARRAHADRPYMALKMFYLLLWPMAACAAVALGALWTAAAGVAERIGRRPVPRRTLDRAAWVLVLGVLFVAARPLARAPRRLHPLPPAVSAPLYEAGLWARANLPAGCIEYLVGDDETAYWLHLAVLGNPRVSARTGDNSTYEPTDAIVRWLTPAGLPYAIADLTALPTDVRNELDIVQPFGSAAVARRRGPSSCAADVR